MSHFSHISFAALTDVGKKRTNNEDSYGVYPEIGVFCVADGMGGGDDGEVASSATVKAIEQFALSSPFPKMATYPIESIVACLRNSVNSASRWIYQRAQENNLKGCGSTFVGICFDASKPSEAKILHAGDSRLYLIRGRSIYQKTKDHSAAELIGAKNEDEINPMFRGMILRAVGIQEKVELDSTPLLLKANDKILICSDGLTKMLSDKKILSLMKDSRNENEAVKKLINAANEAGGYDNITAIVINIGELPKSLPVVEMPMVKTTSVDSDSTYSCGVTQEKNNTSSISFDFDASGKNLSSVGNEVSTLQTNPTANIFEEESETTEDRSRPVYNDATAGALNQLKMLLVNKFSSIVQRLDSKRGRLTAIIYTLVLFCCVSIVLLIVDIILERPPVVESTESHVTVGDENIHFVTSNSYSQVEIHNQEETRIAELEQLRKREEVERLAAEERRKQEEARVAELERIRKDEEAKRFEAEKQRKREEARIAELEQLQKQEEAERLAAEERRKQEEARVAELERIRKNEEAKRLAAEERRKQEEAERFAAEERRKQEEARIAELERQRKEDEALRLAAIKKLKSVCSVDYSISFVRTLKGIGVINGCDEFDAISTPFRYMRDSKTRKEELIASTNLINQIRGLIPRVAEHAEIKIEENSNELDDLEGREDYRNCLKSEIVKMKDLMSCISDIKRMDIFDCRVHNACARLIEMLPKWFKN